MKDLPVKTHAHFRDMEDSERWMKYSPRIGDIVIVTHPKCGTTWTEHIVLNLRYQTEKVPLLYDVAPWVELRCKRDMKTPFPDEELIEWMESIQGTRQMKCHLPLNYLPYHKEIRYIVVGRDTRDAYISWHSHILNAKKKKSFIEIEEDLHKFWPHWLQHGAEKHAPLAEECKVPPFFAFYQSWWSYRHLPNILFIHFEDLLSDAPSQILRIAEFVNVECTCKDAEAVASATSFSRMKNRSAIEMPNHPYIINEGTNKRWRSILNDVDLELYEVTKAGAIEGGIAPSCLNWLEEGNLNKCMEATK